jgi:hypothetical protein
MRRLAIELPVRQLGIDGLERTLDLVESFSLLNRLNLNQSGYVGICRIKLKNPRYNLENLAGHMGVTNLKSIYRESDGAHIALVTGRPVGLLAEAFSFKLYLIGPLEIRDEKMKVGFVGMAGQISKFLGKIERAKIRYRIVSLMDERFSPDSPLSKLTEKQTRILLSAYDLGYYDIPRRFDSEQLAKKLNLGRSTVAEHLRKAEYRIITEVVSQKSKER